MRWYALVCVGTGHIGHIGHIGTQQTEAWGCVIANGSEAKIVSSILTPSLRFLVRSLIEPWRIRRCNRRHRGVDTRRDMGAHDECDTCCSFGWCVCMKPGSCVLA